MGKEKIRLIPNEYEEIKKIHKNKRQKYINNIFNDKQNNAIIFFIKLYFTKGGKRCAYHVIRNVKEKDDDDDNNIIIIKKITECK